MGDNMNELTTIWQEVKDKHLATIISGLMGLAGVLAGVILSFFLQLYSNYSSEKKCVKKEFSEIKISVYSTSTANNLFPELLKLKHFFVRNPKLLKKQGNNHFYQKWLTEPLVEEAFTGVGYWQKGKIEEMFKDLDKTKL